MNFFEGKAVYLACGPTDMRKSINGLVALVCDSFSLDPCAEAVFIFCNRNKDTIKVLLWEENGFWLLQKRLEFGRFLWPQKTAVASEMTMHLTEAELQLLLGGPCLLQKIHRKEIVKTVVI